MTDFLVVGAGSSGAAVAARLVKAGASVCLVEGGPDWGATGQLDERLRFATGLFNFDAYSVMPEYYWQNLESRARPERPTARYLRGKGGGGSSLVNGCYAIRPPLEDFDGWADEGCSGWSGQEVLPYFSRLEQDLDYGSQPYHGSSGPIPIRRLDQSGWGTMDRAFVTVAQETGLPWAPDHNAPGAWGVSPFAANIIGNRRISTGEAYLEPLRGRPNFRIIGDALVDTVLFNGARAVGVRVIKQGKIEELYADEVIISGGSCLSPGILQRSGIGPSSVLGQVGVDTRVELPVGESLQDHQGLLFRLNLKAPAHASEAGQRSNVMARWSSGVEGTRNGDMMACAINVSPDRNAEEVQTASILTVLNQVFSRGSVHITTADPTVMPVMDMNFLSHELDLRRARELYSFVGEIVSRPAMDGLIANIETPDGSAVDFTLSGAEKDARLYSMIQDTAHVTSTCRMGAEDHPLTVVDPECRVLGTESLRVVDASIMPGVTSANTNLAAIMIGERAADLILQRAAVLESVAS